MNDLANKAYCQPTGTLQVTCETVDGVQLPERLSGTRTGIQGALPSSLGELVSVTRLRLKDAADIFSVPTEIGALTGLVRLTLDGVELPSVPTEVGALTALKVLNLGNNQLTSVPTEVGALTNLEDLDLQQNIITSVPTEVAALTSLKILALNNNRLSEVPTEFRTVDPLTACLLEGNMGFSCENVGKSTRCCNTFNCDGKEDTCYTPPCTYADTACVAGSICPGGTAVSAECADRSAFDESPCACTDLQELAALSDTLQAEAPWNDLANEAYCQSGDLRADCAAVDGVKLPTLVSTGGSSGAGLAGALPPSFGELGPSLTYLNLSSNRITSLPTELGALTGLTYLDLDSIAITSVPSEIAALTGLRVLNLSNNQLTGVPTEFWTVDPSVACALYGNPGVSCANVGAGTSCCDTDNCGFTPTCYQG